MEYFEMHDEHKDMVIHTITEPASGSFLLAVLVWQNDLFDFGKERN